MARHGATRAQRGQRGAIDDFSLWHKCRRWTERGRDCPFRMLEDREESEEDAQAKPSGQLASSAVALQAAVGQEMATTGLGVGELLGPLLALFTILHAVQTVKPSIQMGRVTAAGFGEEATVRTLRPAVPAREGPTPARPSPQKVPVGVTKAPAPRGAGGGIGGGGFFQSQQKIMGRLIK